MGGFPHPWMSAFHPCGSEVFLHLCSWHAAEAIKTRLIREGYPIEVRKKLVEQVWSWIKTPTIAEFATNRQLLLNNLRVKEQAYMASFHELKEPQFIMAHTRLQLNLECFSSQRSKSLCPVIKVSAIGIPPLANRLKR